MKIKSEMYIGCAMLDSSILIRYPVAYDAIVAELQPLYIAMQKRALENQPNEPMDLWVAFKGEPWAEAKELTRIYRNAITPTKAGYYAKSLMKDHRTTKFISWLSIAKDLVDGGEIEKAESELIKLYEDNYEAPYVSLQDAAKDWTGEKRLPRIELAHFIDDHWILDKGGFHIVAGRPGMGKTSFMVWLALEAISCDISALFFSLEMPKAQIVSKIFAKNTDAKDKPLFISDAPAQTIESILLKAQLAQKYHGIGLVIVDYVQLVRTKDKFQNREQQVSYISSTLKQLAKQLNVPVVAGCQLNRMMEGTKERRPTLANLRESGALEQDCDSAVLLYRPEYYFKLDGDECPDDQKGRCQLIIAKQRNAPTTALEALWSPEFNTWEGWKTYAPKNTDGQTNRYRGMGGNAWAGKDSE